ncbi:hypothetical protein MY11210_006584 [Beauveria gryllotalpidicola]
MARNKMAFSFGQVLQSPFSTTTAAFAHFSLSNPSGIAVHDLSTNVSRQRTYAELAMHAQALAWHLRSIGVKPDQRVPLVVKRSYEMVIGIWAVLLCGAQYVPLDGGVVPDSTLRHVLHESGGSVLLCVSATENRVRDLFPYAHTVVVEECVDRAGLQPTGTTGSPKGVDVTHDNVTNLVCQYPGNLGIDVLICTPSILAKYQPQQYPNIKIAATAGEPTTQALADLWATEAEYWNCCGPTETTIVNTMSRHVAGQPINIGKPTPNNNVYILDDQMQPVGLGQTGVMWAGGRGVSRGYVGLEQKTKESYRPDPFTDDGSLMYQTGDLGQWDASGNILILGRCDDQVKVKGFRVELDGISSSLLSAPGVSQAAAVFVDGHVHAFVSPPNQDSQYLFTHVTERQPYYAVPSVIHQLESFPVTANGKTDKKALGRIAEDEKNRLDSIATLEKVPQSDRETLVETPRHASFSSATTVFSEKASMELAVPEKKLPQPWRGLAYRILIIYRTLFSLVVLLNVGVLVLLVALRADSQLLKLVVSANLTLAVLVRQDAVINILYTVFCSVPKNAPLWIRRRCAKIYHLGGVHSAAGVCSTIWLLGSNVSSTVSYVRDKDRIDSLASIVVSWMICALCCTMIGFAYPTFRKRYHNTFEQSHRFMGWTTLLLFWVKTVLNAMDTAQPGQDLGKVLVQSPAFWLLVVATCSIASSWVFLRKVPVETVPLSDHAAVLSFTYTVPVNGTFTRISTRPLLEWHSFATIPQPEPNALAAQKGYSLVVSNAGDWTKSCIQNAPRSVWVRGVPTCGVMRIATLFNRIVVIGTGSGIGPLLGHIQSPSCKTQLLWSTKSPEKTFGKPVLDTIYRTIPDAVIHDTATKGRPDLLKMGYNLAVASDAEAVIIIANEKITKKVVYGLETRGIAAYGAIWDS